MSQNIIELVESFSLRESPPDSSSAPLLATHLRENLEHILRTLDKMTSKFVDIDTSFKEVDEEDWEHFRCAVTIFQNPELEANLSEIYRELNLYLIIKDRFGEAADWNLKEECEGRLSSLISQSMHKLSVI